MMPTERLAPTHRADERRCEEVRLPLQHEGIHRALKSSFGEIPPMPSEIDRLLARLR